MNETMGLPYIHTTALQEW